MLQEANPQPPMVDSTPVDRCDFSSEEKKILQFWDSIDAFNLSNELSENRPLWTFYDGPPFATGLPHYGNILAGTIKDVVCRYAYQKGYKVPRRFGWDCHGLPVEHEIDKKLNITCKADIENLGGIAVYNKACRDIVSRYIKEWESTVRRTGRWIDFKNDYKTMYPTFMESVWWVFKALWDKELVYQGYKVLPYSTACTSPLSNFEANLNYKDVVDPAVIVSLPLIDRPGTSLLVWTTTPWTLPSNLAVIVNPDLVYVEILDTETSSKFVVADVLLNSLYKDVSETSKSFKKISSFKGSDLKGWSYEQPFPIFESRRSSHGNFVIVVDSFVTADAGTGLVHCAPAFGEDDHRVSLANKIILDDEAVPSTIDEKGHFEKGFFEGTAIQGAYFKDADKEIIKLLKAKNRIIRQMQHKHSYPFCWRSDTPLIFKAVPSWFIRVTSHIPQLLKNQAETRWVPPSVGEKKFTHWLAAAHDWAVSRNRYWGTPIPVWRSPDGKENIVIGSIEELSRLANIPKESITDLHRENIDHIEIPSQIDPIGRPPLRRVEEVFDCWFESGSVPYGAQHYPFSEMSSDGGDLEQSVGTFHSSFPADFIAEGIDQTRGWFYTLSVLSTLLFDKPPFRNVIVNGLILAADGKKMSKRLKNYPEPEVTMEKFGADALRLYLINSPVVCAEFLKFKEEGVRGILRDVLIPWTNTARFFIEQASLIRATFARPVVGKFVGNLESFTGKSLALISDDIMDRWILSLLQTLVGDVRREMDAYRLYAVVPKLLVFLSSLSSWYLRLSRKRAKNSDKQEDQLKALNTLFHVLYSLTIIMAPFTPFLAERLFKELSGFVVKTEEASQLLLSVHFQAFPCVEESLKDVTTEERFLLFQEAVDQARAIREQKNISLKIPLSSMIIIVHSKEHQSMLLPLLPYISEDLNVRDIRVLIDDDAGKLGIKVVYKALPNFPLLGRRLKTELGALQKALKEDICDADLRAYFLNTSKGLSVSGGKWTLSEEEVAITRSILTLPAQWEQQQNTTTNRQVITLLFTELSEDLLQEGAAREILSRIQQLRKRAGLKQSDVVSIYHDDASGQESIFTNQAEYFERSLKNTILIPKGVDSHFPACDFVDEILIANRLIKLALSNSITN